MKDTLATHNFKDVITYADVDAVTAALPVSTLQELIQAAAMLRIHGIDLTMKDEAIIDTCRTEAAHR